MRTYTARWRAPHNSMKRRARADNAQRKTNGSAHWFMKWGVSSLTVCRCIMHVSLCVVAGFLDGDSKLSQCWGQVFKCKNQLAILQDKPPH